MFAVINLLQLISNDWSSLPVMQSSMNATTHQGNQITLSALITVEDSIPT